MLAALASTLGDAQPGHRRGSTRSSSTRTNCSSSYGRGLWCAFAGVAAGPARALPRRPAPAGRSPGRGRTPRTRTPSRRGLVLAPAAGRTPTSGPPDEPFDLTVVADQAVHLAERRPRQAQPTATSRRGYPGEDRTGPPVGSAIVIDLRLLREDPELIRASQRLRGESTRVVDDLLRADEERRAATQRFEARAGRAEVAGQAGAPRRPATSGWRCWPVPRSWPAEVKAAEAAAADGRRRRCAGPTSRCPTSSRTACRPAARTTSWCCARSATSREIDEPEGPPGDRRGAAGDRHRARGQGVGLAVLLPHRGRRAAPARAAADGDRSRRWSTVSPRRSRRRWSSRSRWRAPASSARTPARSTGSRPTTSTWSARRRWRSPRTTRTRSSTSSRPGAVRRLVVVLPAGGRVVRQGRARHPAGAPVRQGGDVLVLPAGGGRRRAPAAARDGGGDAGQGRDARTG